eukprot:TRINITY_DN737_c0_g1_i2.p1 TRINITY_DN737_c0_g1~~TRINITY_DN737_c0_g1_i2.p1  ORF type:complete len:337 (-),score=105.72 TRINITY_DN737_c0_g1_i2:839-1849(-)
MSQPQQSFPYALQYFLSQQSATQWPAFIAPGAPPQQPPPLQPQQQQLQQLPQYYCGYGASGGGTGGGYPQVPQQQGHGRYNRRVAAEVYQYWQKQCSTAEEQQRGTQQYAAERQAPATPMASTGAVQAPQPGEQELARKLAAGTTAAAAAAAAVPDEPALSQKRSASNDPAAELQPMQAVGGAEPKPSSDASLIELPLPKVEEYMQASFFFFVFARQADLLATSSASVVSLMWSLPSVRALEMIATATHTRPVLIIWACEETKSIDGISRVVSLFKTAMPTEAEMANNSTPPSLHFRTVPLFRHPKSLYGHEVAALIRQYTLLCSSDYVSCNYSVL